MKMKLNHEGHEGHEGQKLKLNGFFVNFVPFEVIH